MARDPFAGMTLVHRLRAAHISFKECQVDQTQPLIRQGEQANEVGYLLVTHSPAPFQREYQRHFG
ncbi:MAG: hypothetical protein V2J07_06005 [Anaerolineae bacterium]|nr:hypothetical protein [Anaerolineae bacterium]